MTEKQAELVTILTYFFDTIGIKKSNAEVRSAAEKYAGRSEPALPTPFHPRPSLCYFSTSIPLSAFLNLTLQSSSAWSKLFASMEKKYGQNPQIIYETRNVSNDFDPDADSDDGFDV